MDKWYGRVKWGKGNPRQRTSAANWKLPLKWNRAEFRQCWHCGLRGDFGEFGSHCGSIAQPVRRRVFCASLADWLDGEVPIEWLADLLALVHATPNLDWLLLSKRPQDFPSRIKAVVELYPSLLRNADGKEALLISKFHNWLMLWMGGYPPNNVWIGTTVEDQARADERIPHLLSIPARVHFLSCEPLLGPVDLLHIRANFREPKSGDEIYFRDGIHWVICGAESGKGARPMRIEWALSLAEQCAAAGVPFFAKQMVVDGKLRHEMADFPEPLRIRQFPDAKEAAHA